MIKNLFGRNKVPTETGTPVVKNDQNRWIKVYELQLSNMEDTPTYELRHQLSVGREVGNIVISDPSLSPRHATFMLQQQVVSVLDHGSIAGTFVNGNKIPAGKNIILEDTDVVKLGDLEIRLIVGQQMVSEGEIPGVPVQ